MFGYSHLSQKKKKICIILVDWNKITPNMKQTFFI